MRLRTSLSLFTGLVVAALVIVLMASVVPLWKSSAENAEVKRGKGLTELLSHSYSALSRRNDPVDLQRLLDWITTQPGVVFAIIVNTEGKVSMSSSILDRRPFFPLEQAPPDPKNLINSSRSGTRYVRDTIFSKPMLDFAAPLVLDGITMGTVRLGIEAQTLDGSHAQILWRFFWIGLLGLIVAITMLSLLSSTITRPMQSLSIGLERLAKREFSARVKASGAGELHHLQESFNRTASALEEHSQNAQKRVPEIEAGYRVLSRLVTTMDRQAMMSGGLEVIAEVLGAERLELLALDPSQEILDRFAIGPSGFSSGSESPAAFELDNFSQVSRLDMLIKKHLGPSESDIFVPLSIDDRPMGALLASCKKGDEFDESARQVASSVTAHLLFALENARLYEFAITDGLTGLTIRRYFQARLRQEIDRARRYTQPFSLMILKIDDMDKLVKEHGLPASDQLLRGLCRRLQDTVRSSDLLSRWSDRTIAVLLLGQGPLQAMAAAQKLLSCVSDRPFSVADDVQISIKISVGAVAFPDHGLLVQDLLDKAIKALEKADANSVNIPEVAAIEQEAEDES